MRRLRVILVSCFVALLLAEFWFRIAILLGLADYPDPRVLERVIHRYAESSDLVYELKPSFRVPRYQTNSWGMRGKQCALEKPAGVHRIAVLGDSLTFGVQLPLKAIYPTLWENRLNEIGQGRHEVLNFGVTGYNSAQQEIVLREKVVRFEPDVVVLSFVINDDIHTYGLGALRREMHPASLGSRLHSKLLSYALQMRVGRRKNARRDFGQVSRLLETLVSLQATHGFRAVVLNMPAMAASPSEQATVERMSQLARQHGFALIDFWELWKHIPDAERKKRFIDPWHLSARGMRKITDELMRQAHLFARQGQPGSRPLEDHGRRPPEA